GRSATRGARRQGGCPGCGAGGPAARLCLLQSDDPCRQREGAHGGVRLPARARAAPGHVPAYAPRRVGRVVHALMQVAALYDVHGNLPALEAVLAEVDAEVILAGGAVVLGPMPVECLGLLQERGATFVRGNCERLVVSPPELAEDLWDARARWVHQQLEDEQ